MVMAADEVSSRGGDPFGEEAAASEGLYHQSNKELEPGTIMGLFDSDSSECPSTHWDLFFWCFLFLMPITAILTYLFWRNWVKADVQRRYQRHGIATQAEIIGKHSRMERIYRRRPAWYSLAEDAADEPEECLMSPFYLKVQYRLDPPIGLVSKKIEVSESLYSRLSAGNVVEMICMAGYPRSAQFLSEFESSTTNFSIDLCIGGLCWLLVMGLCFLNACVSYGWEIIFVTFLGTFGWFWVRLDWTSGQRQKLFQSIVDPPEPEAQDERQMLMSRNA